MPFGTEILEWRGYPIVKNFDDMFIRFDRMQRDRHTNGQTPHDDIGRACITSRGKKLCIANYSNVRRSRSREYVRPIYFVMLTCECRRILSCMYILKLTRHAFAISNFNIAIYYQDAVCVSIK